MKNDGLLIVLSGFSGTGKGTIVKEVLRRYPDRYALSVSATTRSPRPGEADGREYFFCTDEQFREMIMNGDLLEYAGYIGHYYGTPRAYAQQQLAAGKNVILEIERRGAMQVRGMMPQAVLIFVLPPSVEELERRLRGRGTETDEVIAKRLAKAAEEISFAESFDYIIVNDDLDRAVSDFDSIIASAACKTAANGEVIARIAAELEAYK